MNKKNESIGEIKDRIDKGSLCKYIVGSGFIFFEDDNDSTPKHSYPREKLAKAICAGCPSNELCLAYSIKTNQEWGIWGGKTYPERRKMVKQLLKSKNVIKI